MARFKLIIEYDGRPFMGWQQQAHGPSVQAAIQDAIAAITGEDVLVYGSGRTDSGVHARGQVAHVDIEKKISAFRLAEGINAQLRPQPVSVLSCEEVHDDFHARFDAKARTYEYIIVNRRAPLTIESGLAWHATRPLDADAMHTAAQQLVGKHDFTTFRAAQCQAKSPIKTLDRLDVERRGERIIISAAARSFLHHQVRSMVGCLKLVGEGKWTAADLKNARDAADRDALGFNAPPDGLYFMAVKYD